MHNDQMNNFRPFLFLKMDHKWKIWTSKIPSLPQITKRFITRQPLKLFTKFLRTSTTWYLVEDWLWWYSQKVTVNICVFKILPFFDHFFEKNHLNPSITPTNRDMDSGCLTNASSYQNAGLVQRITQNVTVNTSVFQLLNFFLPILSNLIFRLPNDQDNHFYNNLICPIDT